MVGKRTLLGVVTGVAVLGLGLNACSAAPDIEPTRAANATSSPSPESSSTTIDAETANPVSEQLVPTVLAGDLITTPEQFAALFEAGLGYYTYGDGSAVAVDLASPLPPDVTYDIQARLNAIPADDTTDNGSSAIRNFDAERAILSDTAMTGKGVITLRLRSMAVPHEDGSIGGMRWVATANTSSWWMQWERNRDVLRANVDAWITANGGTQEWAVFTAPGPLQGPDD
jgi:hypothetical protein